MSRDVAMMGTINRYITIKGQYDGFHKYEDAPDEVAFLKNLHRHLFKWEAQIEVFHDDREVEFFMAQMVVNRRILPFVNQKLDLGSCEQQAFHIMQGLMNEYGNHRYYNIEVSEDGENSGVVTYDPRS